MLVYNSAEETFYDTETGLISKAIQSSECKIEDQTIDRICSTIDRVLWFLAITILGVVLKEYPPAQLLS